MSSVLPSFDPKVLRRHVLYMANQGQTVHIPCAFSMVEILSVLHSKLMRYNPKDPADPKRDYFVLSKGHGVMAMYACMRELGWVEQRDLDKYFSDGSKLHGLSESHVPGLEVTSGSLGHGLPIAVGIALGLKKRGQMHRKVYCVVGDGELNEGSMWEALMIASQHQLSNLVVIVDANGFQAMGRVETILNMEPMADKFTAFGFAAEECDGHDLAKLQASFERLNGKTDPAKPKALVARTIKGKGVSFMESNNEWHYTRLNADTYARAMQEVGGA